MESVPILGFIMGVQLLIYMQDGKKIKKALTFLIRVSGQINLINIYLFLSLSGGGE
jgi:hypothetical protein